MIINYIHKRPIDSERVASLLSQSAKLNHFSNNGPVKAILEDALHRLLVLPTSKKVVCTSSGTAALHLLMYHYSDKRNRPLRWLSPSFTFPSCVVNSANTSVCDIDADTCTIPIDLDLSGFDGLILTNLFGSFLDLKRWDAYAKAHGKIVVYDNAASPLSECEGLNICAFGNASVGSLHHTKYLGFGEGGFVVVDAEDADEVSRKCNFGFNQNRIHSPLSSNFKMSDVAAAYILQNIEQFDRTRFLDVQSTLIDVVSRHRNVSVFKPRAGVVYGNLPLLFRRPIDSGVFRDLSIEANKYYRPVDPTHQRSRQLYDHIINLPLHQDLDAFQIDHLDRALAMILS